MVFLATFDYMQSSPGGGTARRVKENKLMVVETEKELAEKVDAFLADDKCGYRKYIDLVEIKRI